MNKQVLPAIFTLCCFAISSNIATAEEGAWSGNIAAEARVFFQDPIDDKQQDSNLSVSAQPEYYRSWDKGDQSFLFIPFARIDQHDKERTHADIRELSWLKVSHDWELRLGIRKVFWGVTESQHLVDIINQTDLVENLDGEDKLGQPMVNLALIGEWGTVDLFVLPYFRERTFPGEEGRFRTFPPVDTDNPVYEDSDEEKHIDFAVRWSRFVGVWDIGLSYFTGTSRDPGFIPNSDGSALLPVYNQIDQAGLDPQATIESWLWKLEAITRSEKNDRYSALTGGFEYTYVGVFETATDVGIVVEYLFDDRGDNATTPFEDDILLAARLTLNDVQSSELLAGFILDMEGDATSFNLEASRRLGDAWKLSIEARTFSNIDNQDPLYSFNKDDHLQAELAWYF